MRVIRNVRPKEWSACLDLIQCAMKVHFNAGKPHTNVLRIHQPAAGPTETLAMAASAAAESRRRGAMLASHSFHLPSLPPKIDHSFPKESERKTVEQYVFSTRSADPPKGTRHCLACCNFGSSLNFAAQNHPQRTRQCQHIEDMVRDWLVQHFDDMVNRLTCQPTTWQQDGRNAARAFGSAIV